MTTNVDLYKKIVRNELNTETLLKALGFLFLNPLSIAVATKFIFQYEGMFIFLLQFLVCYMAAAAIYFVSSIIIGILSQIYAVSLYSKMSYSLEKLEALQLIQQRRDYSNG